MEEIIQAVHFYRYVTAHDITRLFFASASITYVRELLHTLAGGGDHTPNQYLYRFPLPNIRVGNTEKIYTLGSKGRSYLQEQGLEVDWYFRPSDASALTYQHLQHALTLTRFLIAAKLFVRNRTDIVLTSIRTEYELKQEAAKVNSTQPPPHNQEQTTVPVIPDAWLNFHFPHTTPSQRPILLEIDRGTEQQKYFKRHVQSRMSFVRKDGPYQSLFGTSAVTIAYATTGNEIRLESMRRWIEEVLEETNRKNWASIFRLCKLPPQTLNPQVLFQAPTWYQPFEKQPVSLFS